jgi:hypothetical protein
VGDGGSGFLGHTCCPSRVYLARLCSYESEGRARKTVKAQQLWFAVLEAQIEVRGRHYDLVCRRSCGDRRV